MSRLHTVEKMAARLSTPQPSGANRSGQSLAEGAAGIALLHIELAAAGRADWRPVRTWLKEATSQPVSIGANAGLYFGAPALEFVVRAAAPYLPAAASALPRLGAATDKVTRDRLRSATLRRSRGELPALAEFDLIRGLTGLGALLLWRRDAGTALLGDVLAHLVDLTRPMHGHERLPGWWTLAAPGARESPQFPTGHGNNGMAHGIAGPLALLALAMRQGVTVQGHADAIGRITSWLERWPAGRAPYWSIAAEQHAHHSPGRAIARPSWCYGALGVLRAQQLAALAVGDSARRAAAEDAARATLTAPAIRDLTRDATLCHGWAGLLATAVAISADCPDPGLFTDPVRSLAEELAAAPALGKNGLLEGQAGAALGLHALRGPPATGWTRALLIN